MTDRLGLLYSQVPAMADCKGKCADSCYSPFDYTEMERVSIEHRAGKRLVPGDTCTACSMLTADGRCSVYDDRPMICRLFGTAPMLRCEHGCRPVKWLTDADAVLLLAQVANLDGADYDIEQMRRNLAANPDFARTALILVRAGAL